MQKRLYKYSILFIEDEKAIRENYVNYLKKYFTNVYEADNGLTALKIYKEKRPELLIVDIHIPKISGLELLKQIRVLDQSTRAIILTAQTDVEILLAATELKLSKYLVKPITRLQLTQALDKAVEEIESFTISANKLLSFCGEYQWNFQTQELSCKGTTICLTRKESLFISYMMNNYKKTSLYDDIIYELWNEYDEKKRDSLKSLVRKIRKKLPEDFIENHFGMGYKIKLIQS